MHPHGAYVTCGEPHEIELTPIEVVFNVSRRVRDVHGVLVCVRGRVEVEGVRRVRAVDYEAVIEVTEVGRRVDVEVGVLAPDIAVLLKPSADQNTAWFSVTNSMQGTAVSLPSLRSQDHGHVPGGGNEHEQRVSLGLAQSGGEHSGTRCL